MKKKQWMIGLIILGIIVVGIGVCVNLRKNDDKSSTKQEDISDREEDETEFVPFITEEEDVSKEQRKSSNTKESKTSSAEESNTSSSGEVNSSSSSGTAESPSNDSETDSITSDESGNNTSTELPFVPFE